MAALDYDFSVLKKKEKSIAMKLGSLATAMRQYALAQEVKEYLKDHPNALIVNMGCGLDTTGHLADNGPAALSMWISRMSSKCVKLLFLRASVFPVHGLRSMLKIAKAWNSI